MGSDLIYFNSGVSVEYRNDILCSSCNEPCCEIYGKWRNTQEWFEDWCLEFHGHRDDWGKIIPNYFGEGVVAKFDPLVVFLTGNEHMIDELVAQGINPRFCEYWNKDTGCEIERKKRPTVCREFKCPKMSDVDRIIKYKYPLLPYKSE
jgi:hypothetical protein